MTKDWWSKPQQITLFQERLSDWFSRHARILPFRKAKDPYRVWVSEIMLQQTTMTSMLPYYERFMTRFPSPEALARASETDVLGHWQGLGYYSRARNLHKASQKLVTAGKKWPHKAQDWQELPGIGEYTSAAVASICFDDPSAVMDGNVMRVAARLTAYPEDLSRLASRKILKARVDSMLDKTNPGHHNQAMMELGALVCRPKPDCPACPVKTICLGTKKDPLQYPIRKKMKVFPVTWHALVMHDGKKILMVPPDTTAHIKGMWSLPILRTPTTTLSLESWGQFRNTRHQEKLVRIGQVKHAITDKAITAIVHKHPWQSPVGNDLVSVACKELPILVVNTLSRKIMDACL
jgi:A/G-specific adenine glycosylase